MSYYKDEQGNTYQINQDGSYTLIQAAPKNSATLSSIAPAQNNLIGLSGQGAAQGRSGSEPERADGVQSANAADYGATAASAASAASALGSTTTVAATGTSTAGGAFSGVSGSMSGTSAGSLSGLSGSTGSYLAVAADALRAYQNFTNDRVADKKKNTQLQKDIARGVADWYTGGLAGMALDLAHKNKTFNKWEAKLDKWDAKTNPSTMLMNRFASSKGQGQVNRDWVRKELVKNKVIDDKYQIQLADGSTFDMGADGNAMLKNADGSERKYKYVDFDRKDLGDMRDNLALLTPLGQLATLGYDKQTSADMAAYFTNAATSNAKNSDDVLQNAKTISEKFGVTTENLPSIMEAFKKTGNYDDETLKVYEAKLKQLAETQSKAAKEAAEGKATVSLEDLLPKPDPRMERASKVSQIMSLGQQQQSKDSYKTKKSKASLRGLMPESFGG
jgi:hypothetical protein